MPSDTELLCAYAEHGTHDAFHELVRRHLPLVYRSALRQLNCDTHRAEDVAQMVFVALAQQANALRTHPNLAGWLYATTHRTTCHVIRTEMRRRKREEAWAADPTTSAEAGDSAMWTAIAPMLDESIRGLPRGEREAIVLRFFSNRSFTEVGEALQIGEDAARMRVNRALEKLRARFAVRNIVVTSSALGGLLLADTALGAPSGLTGTIATAAAHAQVATSITGAVTSFMAGSKVLATAAAIGAAIAIGIATQQWSAAQTAQTELENALGTIASLRARLVHAERQRPVGNPVASTNAPPAFDKAAFLAEFASGDVFLAAHPQVRDAMIQSQRARIRGKYLPLYLELHLTSAQIAAFEAALLGAGGKSLPDGSSVFVGEHLTPSERNDRVRTILGADGFARYQAAQITGPSSRQAVAEQLAVRLACTDEPLSLETSIAIRDIFDDARTIVGAKQDPWPEALPRLEQILTKTQMDEVRALRSLDRYWRAQLNEKVAKGSP
jgi:RNA polymerase sigma factor (sigma-70 family)